MSEFHLDIDALMRAVDHQRRAGHDDEISYRKLARDIGVHSGFFTRLRAGQGVRLDPLLTLLMWLQPGSQLNDFMLPGPRPQRAARTPRRPVA